MMRLFLPATLGVSLVACVVERDATSTDTQSVEIHNRIAANRIAANRIAANRIAANRIAANRIAANRLTLSTTADDLINTADGREVLDYIVSCAIPEGTTLVGTASDGTQYEFNGEIGVAPQWIDEPLDDRSGAWVSACLFSRVNENDVAVDVSLRGPSPALTTSASERADWSVEEGAFYGMLFLPVTQPIEWYACSGRNNLEAHTTQQRDCATPDPSRPGLTLCGFFYAGDCGDYTAVRAKTACESQSSADSGGYYRECSTHPEFVTDPHRRFGDDHRGFDHGHNHCDWDDGDHDFDHHHGHSCEIQQVITTYVQP